MTTLVIIVLAVTAMFEGAVALFWQAQAKKYQQLADANLKLAVDGLKGWMECSSLLKTHDELKALRTQIEQQLLMGDVSERVQ